MTGIFPNYTNEDSADPVNYAKPFMVSSSCSFYISVIRFNSCCEVGKTKEAGIEIQPRIKSNILWKTVTKMYLII